VGKRHSFTVTVEKDSGAGFGPAAGISFVPIVDGVGAIDLDASTCDDVGTDAAGNCEIVVVSDAAGDSVVRVMATVTVAGTNGSAGVAVDTAGYGSEAVDNRVTWEAPAPPAIEPAPEPVVIADVFLDVTPDGGTAGPLL
jgi:hypothetical protein